MTFVTRKNILTSSGREFDSVDESDINQCVCGGGGEMFVLHMEKLKKKREKKLKDTVTLGPYIPTMLLMVSAFLSLQTHSYCSTILKFFFVYDWKGALLIIPAEYRLCHSSNLSASTHQCHLQDFGYTPVNDIWMALALSQCLVSPIALLYDFRWKIGKFIFYVPPMLLPIDFSVTIYHVLNSISKAII